MQTGIFRSFVPVYHFGTNISVFQLRNKIDYLLFENEMTGSSNGCAWGKAFRFHLLYGAYI